MSLLPTHRETTSSTAFQDDPNATQVDLGLPIPARIAPNTAVQHDPHATQVDLGLPAPARIVPSHTSSDDEKNFKKGTSSEPDQDEKASEGSSSNAYLDKGLIDIESEEGKRTVQVVLEQKSGKELIKELGGGPYTDPRW